MQHPFLLVSSFRGECDANSSEARLYTTFRAKVANYVQLCANNFGRSRTLNFEYVSNREREREKQRTKCYSSDKIILEELNRFLIIKFYL